MRAAILIPLLLALLAACAPATGGALPAGAPEPPAGSQLASPAGGAPAAAARPDNPEVILATTTSTQDSGLLDVLVPLFERASGYRLKPIAVGTGQALALGERGEADIVLVHAPDAERAWMAAGHGTERLLVMHNDFVLVGPPSDPAGLRGAPTAAEALRRIATTRAPWISRGDQSGTHLVEQRLWQTVGLDASGIARPDPRGHSWYQEAGQGMGQTLNIASEKRAYTLADRGTWLARRGTLELAILVEGEQDLLNVYHVMPVNPAKSPRINAAGGQAFATWLVGPEAQAAIGEYGRDRFGQPLFFPDAGRGEAELGPSDQPSAVSRQETETGQADRSSATELTADR
jgi:tungstate transport system substrate-binding protein